MRYWQKLRLEPLLPTNTNLKGGVVAGATLKGTSVVQGIAQGRAQQAAIQSLNPISQGLVKLGLKQAPKVASKYAAGIAGVGSLVSGLATDYVVETILKDDENLPQHELEARRNGRIAGQVGTTVGAIAGTAGAAMIGGTAALVTSAIAAPVVLGLGAAFAVYQFSKQEDKQLD